MANSISPPELYAMRARFGSQSDVAERLYNPSNLSENKSGMPAADHSAVRAQMGKILSSPVFANSPRMSRFLRFVVETTLDGKGARIKEYVIALEVFEKAEDYDPQADSTVRTEASKLRSRLGRYYDTEGSEDSIIISVPKGSYVPTFENRENASAVSPPPGSVVTPHAAFSWLKASALLIAVGIALAGGVVWLRRSPPSPAPRLVQLTSYPELEEQPSLSPDGSQVAFRWKGDIYVKQVGAEAFIQVTKDPAVDSWPVWSPDGSQIAFVRNGEVFLVSPLGGAERKVAESAGRVVWMPDGQSLLVLDKTSRYARSIFSVLVATGEKRRLTFPHDLSPGDIDMAASPDGRSIAVCRTVTTEGCDLYLIPVSGGEPRRLTNDLRSIQGLAWTRDGRQIVFSSNRQGWFRLWRVSARPASSPGSYENPVLVEAAGDDTRYPSISRSHLVYQRYIRNFDIQRVEIIGAEGSAAHHLKRSTPLIASTRTDVTPSWSPDGKKIAFVSDRLGARELWVCDADGSNPLKLTSFAGQAVIYPRWSPDGQRLVFSALTGADGNFEGYVIGSRGGAPKRINVQGHDSMAHAVFSADGNWLYFIPGAQESSVEAWGVPATGGSAAQITRNGAFRPEESPDGKLLYYGKYGSRGLWTTPLAGGPERQVLDSVTAQNWTVASQGIYYIDFAVEPGAPKGVWFYSFQTSKTNRVGTVEPTVSPDFSGISVSRDGRWLLYSHIANISSDLMMVDLPR